MEKSTTTKLSRRKFLGAAGGITFVATAAILVPRYLRKSEKDGQFSERKEITVWVQIQEDGQVIIYNPASEMGQGSMTALPIIFAEEMDADWSKVRIENSPIEPDIYGAGWGGERGGSMITVGSRTVRAYYNNMRQSGAQARYVLLANVAKKWTVPVEELSTEPGWVVHLKSDRKISYGEIAQFAEPIKDIPEIPEDQLKNPNNFRLIGKLIPRFDIPAKVDGSAQYGIDVQVPNMVYGVINRAPVHGTSPSLKNEDSIRNIPGIIDVVPLEHGIGLIAESIEIALQTKGKASN